MIRSHRTLLLVIAVSLVLRLGVFVFALTHVGANALVYGDAIGPEGYVTLASNLAHGLGFSFFDANGVLTQEVFRTPGLPMLLSPFTLIQNGVAVYGALLAIIAGILLPLLTYLVGIRLIGKKAALIAAALVAVEPHLIFFSFIPQSEMPFILFAFGGLLAALYAYEARSYLTSVLSGALFAYACFIRPGFFDVLLVCGVAAAAVLWWQKEYAWRMSLVVMCTVVFFLAPWYVRNYAITGAASFSGAGWRNVYTDYLASVRAIENHSDFSSEKAKLKQEAAPRFGLSVYDINSPAAATTLRNAALAELWQHKSTVIKLEAVLLTTFFFQDGYYYEFVRYGLVTNDSSHQSATFALLTKGFAGLRDVFTELVNQDFIPLWGRAFTLATFLCAIAGFFFTKSRLRWLFAAAIILTAVVSTVIGLGVEARLRLPVEPLLFMFSAATLMRIWEIYLMRRSKIKSV